MSDLSRFVEAQERTYAGALAELRAGAKRGHWMWFVFPQIAGLGRSDMAVRYAIEDLAEARAYLAHPLLGGRYRECVDAMLCHEGRTAASILGEVDALKLRSSLTLFVAAGGTVGIERAIAAFYPGPDPATLARLR